MHRRAFVAAVAALPATGCIDALTREQPDPPADGPTTTSLTPDGSERARIVLVEVDETGPTLTGVVVNFRDERIDVEVVAEFYETVDGIRETVWTRTETLLGLNARQGERFAIPFPSTAGPEDGVRYDLQVEVTAVLD